MCGIAGIYRFDGRAVEQSVLSEMTLCLRHRGPETLRSVVVDELGAAGLGHARLRIIDLSVRAAQPMSNASGTLQIVFNGEVYNFRELREDLRRTGAEFRTESDTEVLLQLYERDGPECIKRVAGMFAFAIWDARDRSMFLARDCVGKKPLFYWASPRMLAFASEIKALLRHPEIPAPVNEEMLPHLFFHGYVPGSQTLYKGIQQVPPGHTLMVKENGSLRLEQYWTVDSTPHRSVPPREIAVKRVRELVTDAVRRRLIADVPLGAFLSGGLDSTVVVGVMSQLMQEPVRTFSIGFASGPGYDERHYARLAADRFGTKHTEFVVEPSAVNLVDRLVWHHDGPFGDSSAVPTYLLSRLAREHVTVALSGDGGDELFAGYRRFAVTAATERVPLAARRLAKSITEAVPEWGGRDSIIRRARRFARVIDLPLTARLGLAAAIFTDDVAELVPSWRHTGPVAVSLDPAAAFGAGRRGTALGRLLDVNLKSYLPADLLVKADRCSMAHALEVRSPFLDPELIEFVAGLPDRMKLRFMTSKAVLREAFADMVPDEILRRPKMGFAAPLDFWFRGELRDYIRDVLLSSDARLRQYVNQEYVRHVWSTHVAGREDFSSRLWMLLTFEVWLRALPGWRAGASPEGIDGPPVAAVVPA